MQFKAREKILSPKLIREYSARKTKLDSTFAQSVQSKREKIFTSELKYFVERVKSPHQASKLPVSLSSFGKIYKNLVSPEKRQEQILLESIYMPAHSIQDISIIDYTSYILVRVGIDTFSWHFKAYDSNAYFSEFSRGVDMITRKNFLFSKSDPYLKKIDGNFYEIEITNEYRKDPFFAKKFSIESINLYSRIYFFFLDEPYVDACLLAFLEKNLSESKESETDLTLRNRWLKRVGEKIHVLIPAIKRYREEKLQPKFSKDDMLTPAIYQFRMFIGLGLDEFYVSKLRICNVSIKKGQYYLERQFLSQILHDLNDQERIIYAGVHTYLIFSFHPVEERIRKIAERDQISILITMHKYPADGENILVYL